MPSTPSPKLPPRADARMSAIRGSSSPEPGGEAEARPRFAHPEPRRLRRLRRPRRARTPRPRGLRRRRIEVVLARLGPVAHLRLEPPPRARARHAQVRHRRRRAGALARIGGGAACGGRLKLPLRSDGRCADARVGTPGGCSPGWGLKGEPSGVAVPDPAGVASTLESISIAVEMPELLFASPPSTRTTFRRTGGCLFERRRRARSSPPRTPPRRSGRRPPHRRRSPVRAGARRTSRRR